MAVSLENPRMYQYPGVFVFSDRGQYRGQFESKISFVPLIRTSKNNR